MIESQIPDDIPGRPDQEGGFIVSTFKVKNADSIHYWNMVLREWHVEVGSLSKEMLKQVLSDLALSGDALNIIGQMYHLDLISLMHRLCPVNRERLNILRGPSTKL